MKLPEMYHPTFDVVIPSTQQKTKIRPMLVREEKILLMAKASDNSGDVFGAIEQICGNCLVNGDVNVKELAMFDLEYLFLKIRAISVSNKVTVSIIDKDDNKTYPIEIDLNKVEVKLPEKDNTKIETGPDSGFLMRYPRASLFSSEMFKNPEITENEILDEMILDSVVQYFEGDQIYNMKDNTHDEIKKFLEDLEIPAYNKLREFINNIPSLSHEIKYTNSEGKEKTEVLSTLSDFFIL